MSRKEVGLPTEYILVVEMITVTVFYRITRKTILSGGKGFLHRSCDHEKYEVNGVEVETGEPLLTLVRNRELLTMEGFNMESMFGRAKVICSIFNSKYFSILFSVLLTSIIPLFPDEFGCIKFHCPIWKLSH